MTSSTMNEKAFTANLTRRTLLKGTLGAAVLGTIAGPAGVRPAGAATGGKITIGWNAQGAFGSIDPHRSTGDVATDLANNFNVFEALTRQTNEGRIEMWLAESVTADDATATVWTIRLKKGVLFHDGREFKADDAIFSIKRIREPGTISGGHIGPVKSFEKIDDHTIRLVLEAPRSWLPTGLSDPFSSMVPDGYDPEKPVGTGPFKVGSVTPKESISLIRNEAYHGTKAVLDEVTLRPFEDASALLNALQSGQVDIVNQLDPSLIGELEGNSAFSIYNSPTGKFMPIQMRTDVAPFSDPRLRKALRLAIDRDAVLNSVYNGYAQIGNDLYGRYDPDFAGDLSRKQNIAEAKALVEEAGLTGTNLELVMYADVATALVLAENAKEIGINITVKQLDGASFYNEEYMERPFFGGDYYPSGPFFLISSLADGPNAGLDQVRWRDKEYLDLWVEASNTLDPAKRSAMTHKLQEILFDRGAWIIPVYGNETAVCKAGISGLPETDQTGAGVLRALSKLHIAG